MVRYFRLFLLFLLTLSSTATATMVLPLSLKEMTDQAGKIFVGRCQEISTDLDEQGIPSTYVRLRVLEAIKGVSAGSTVLVKQYGTPPRRLSVAEGERAIVPFFSPLSAIALGPGEESLLFLYPESRLGFTSPVGLMQGKFMIRPAPDGMGPRDLQGMIREVRRILRDE